MSDDLSWRQVFERWPITSLCATASIPLAVFAVVFFLSHDDEERYQVAAEESFQASKYDDHLLALDREAVDNAYRDQVEHLIAIWFKDDSGQPGRATKGVQIARKRYIDMMAAIEKREADIKKLKELQR